MVELMALPLPLPSAGQRAPRLATLRWLLLACTLLGLAAMHTIGHTGAGHAMAIPERPTTHQLQTAAVMLTEHAVHVAAASVREACPGDCAHVSGGAPEGGHPGSWSVCLTILATLAVVVLVGWLLRTATVSGGVSRSMRPLAIAPRAPPLPGVGLRLADLSVLRR